jgi:hypothetical protein
MKHNSMLKYEMTKKSIKNDKKKTQINLLNQLLES